MATKLQKSMMIAVATAGLLTVGALVAQTKPAPTKPTDSAQTKQAVGKANGSYPIVVGKNAVEVTDEAKRKAAFADAEAGAPQASYKVLDVSLPAQVNQQLGIEGDNTVALPQGAENPQVDVTGNEMSLSWDESPDGDGDAAVGTEAKKGCANRYYKDGKWCKSHKRDWWYSNNTAWFKGTNQYMYWHNDNDKKYNYWAIKREGICKSKGVWTMLSCGIGSKKRTSISQRILEVSPKQDKDLDDCASVSLGVEIPGISLGGEYQACDSLDVNFPNRTSFSNYWRGLKHRTERAVEYQYIVRTKQGERPRFTLWSPYQAR